MTDTLSSLTNVDPARAKLADKLAAIVAALKPVSQRGAVTRSNGGVLYTYALDIDELEPIRALLAAKGLHLASDVDPEHFHHFEREIEKSGQNGAKYVVWEYKVALFERTVITDGETGAQLTYLHPGMAVDDDPANACKQAQTSARRSMFRGVFNIVIDDSTKAKTNRPAAGGAGGDTNGGAKGPAEARQIARIKTQALARGIELNSPQMAAMLKTASRGYAKGIATDGMSFGDAENLIKALEALPLPTGAPATHGAAHAPVEQVPLVPADQAAGESDVEAGDDEWPPSVSDDQVEKLNALLSSKLLDGTDIDALVVEVSKHRTGDLGELTGDEIDTLIAKLRQLVAKRKAGHAA